MTDSDPATRIARQIAAWGMATGWRLRWRDIVAIIEARGAVDGARPDWGGTVGRA